MFDEFDKNKSGTLCINVSRELYKELCSKSNDQFEFSEDLFFTFFNEWNSNGDGSINRDELNTLLMKIMVD